MDACHASGPKHGLLRAWRVSNKRTSLVHRVGLDALHSKPVHSSKTRPAELEVRYFLSGQHQANRTRQALGQRWPEGSDNSGLQV